MPIHSINITDTFVEINDGGNVFRLDYSNIPVSHEQKAEYLRQSVQDWLDYRINLNDLSADDPDKTIDPGRPDLFHEGQGGNAELVARPIVIENVIWDGIKFGFTLRRNR